MRAALVLLVALFCAPLARAADGEGAPAKPALVEEVSREGDSRAGDSRAGDSRAGDSREGTGAGGVAGLEATRAGDAGALTFTLELPVALSATTASSGVETGITVWPGARGTVLYALDELFVAGGDLTLSGTFESAGTDRVSVARYLAGVEGRALVGLRLGGGFARFVPYGYAGPFVGLGVGWLESDAGGLARFLASPGLRAGVGAMLRLGLAQARLDLGAGVRDARAEITTSFSLGAAF